MFCSSSTFVIAAQACWGISPESSIVPNTLDTAIQPTKEVRICSLPLLCVCLCSVEIHSEEIAAKMCGRT
jgi:hypothetical protein